jgi:hypothetical protein
MQVQMLAPGGGDSEDFQEEEKALLWRERSCQPWDFLAIVPLVPQVPTGTVFHKTPSHSRALEDGDLRWRVSFILFITGLE